MAENAANFTLTYQNKPSIFEILAQKSLNDTLHPALQKLALFLATNLPEKFSWLHHYYEETFLVLNGLLQYHYLKYYDASFSENFYGLKRVLFNGENLKDIQKEYSLLFLVLFPYVKKKLDEKIAIFRIEQAEGNFKKDVEGKMKYLALFLYSSSEILWNLILIYNYIKYMSGQTEFQLPILKMINIKLAYDVEPKMSSDSFWTSLFKGNMSISRLSFDLIRNAITTSLEVGAFFLQFLQSWQNQKSSFNMTDLPSIIPPPLDIKSQNFQGKCPVCLKPWIIPTVLQVSGYIFCFRCILKFLNENQKCPVTNLPAKPLDIVRLYIN